jgi:hypothetical protein
LEEKETLQRARDIYIQQFKAKAEELRPLFKKISSLDQDVGDSTDLGAMLAEILTQVQTPESAQFVVAGSGGCARPSVRPDAFVGDTYSIAAKKYLKQVGYAVSVDEIVDVLRKGGCPVGGVDPRKTLYISLVRDVRTFYPIPGKMGFVGLREFYPNLKGKKPGRPKKTQPGQ